MENNNVDISLGRHLSTVKVLVEQGACLDSRNWKGQTALDIAAEKNDFALVKLLLELGADFDRDYGKYGRLERETTLHLAAAKSTLEVISTLIEYGADTNVQDRKGETPAHRAGKAGRLDVLKLLWSEGADLTVQDRDGWTPLLWAVWTGAKEAVAWLLEDVGENPNRLDFTARTPLHIAAMRGHKEIVILLILQGADPWIRDSQGKTPLELVDIATNAPIAELLSEILKE